jgi:hypothetical protein
MILHAASIAAFFVDQLAQPPVQVQCVQQATPSPEWKWWIGALAPWIGPLLSGVVSIYVAWRVFHWQGEKDRKRWALDQKKAEWSALLRGVANVFHITNFTPLNGWNGEIATRIAAELERALEEISIACANCIFLANFRQNKEGEKKISEFLKNTKLQTQKLKGNLGLSEDIIDRRDKAGSMTDRDSKSFYRNLEVISDLISNLAKQSRSLLDWLQDEAALDLGVTARGEEHQAARRWTKLFNFTRKKTGA